MQQIKQPKYRFTLPILPNWHADLEYDPQDDIDITFKVYFFTLKKYHEMYYGRYEAKTGRFWLDQDNKVAHTFASHEELKAWCGFMESLLFACIRGLREGGW